MGDELCDSVVMGAVQLQATFSGWPPALRHPRWDAANVTRRGTLEQRLHTRYGWCVVCITLIACLALHHHRRHSHDRSLNSLHSTRSQPAALRPIHDGATVTRNTRVVRGLARWGWEQGSTCGGGLGLNVRTQRGVAHSPTDACDVLGFAGSCARHENAACGPPAARKP